MQIRTFVFAALAAVSLTGSALAVSIAELAGNCGEDGDRYCEGVSYGEDMQNCLNANYSRLGPACKAIMDRLNDGERVTLF